MKRLFISLFLSITGLQIAVGQTNLVLNPSFEVVNGCPAGQNYVDSAFYWYNPTSQTPDLFLSCTFNGESNHVPNSIWGYQYPHSGNNYVGFGSEFEPVSWSGREYLGGTLSDTLKPGKKYIVEMYLSLAYIYSCTFKGIGVYFSDTQQEIFTAEEIPVIPQVTFDTTIYDTTNWVKVSDTMTAVGGENYFIIGLFSDNLNSEIDTIFFDTINPSLLAYFFVDDVSVTMIEDTTEPPPPPTAYPEIKIYPIPSSDGIFSLEYTLPNGGEMLIHDALGQIVGRVSLEIGANLKTLSFISLASGVYHYRILADGQEQKAGKLVITK